MYIKYYMVIFMYNVNIHTKYIVNTTHGYFNNVFAIYFTSYY